jgi:hypothetical protein
MVERKGRLVHKVFGGVQTPDETLHRRKERHEDGRANIMRVS